MKRFSKVLVSGTVLATLALTSCGGSTTEEPAAEEPAAEEPAEEVTEEPAEEEATTGGEISGEELVQNANARKAIAMGFDKEYIVNDIMANGSIAADYFVPQNFLLNPDGGDWRDGASDYLVYDVTAAQEYWALAKEELGFDTVEVELLNYDSDSSKKIGEFMKSELEQNLEGLTFTLKPVPFQQKLELGRGGDFQLNFAGWAPDYLDATTFLDMWLTGGSYNDAGYVNSTYDELVTGDYETEQERYEAHVEAERILLEEDAVMAPVYQRSGVLLQRPEVSGIITHTFGADYSYNWVELDREDKVLHLLETSKAPTLDTNLVTDAVSFNVLNGIGEGLVSLGQEGSNVIPAIAESWDESEDGLTYTFHLRQDATFVDYQGNVVGNVTAQSFVDSWARLEDESMSATYGYLVRDTAHIDTYTAVDDYTLEVTLTEETPWFLSLMSFGTFQPIHKESVDSFGDAYGTTLETTISTGPFYLTTWNFNERVVMSKNPHYYGADEVKIDGVDFRVIEGVENDTSVGMYFNGELDRVGLSGENVTTYQDHDDVQVVEEPTIFYLLFRVNE
ncbi:MAG: ABC transporter substrate-binding protein [Lachnospirales bacterium]